jgi:hypothetical protein
MMYVILTAEGGTPNVIRVWSSAFTRSFHPECDFLMKDSDVRKGPTIFLHEIKLITFSIQRY